MRWNSIRTLATVVSLAALPACLPMGTIHLKEKTVDGKPKCYAKAPNITVDKNEQGYVWLVDADCEDKEKKAPREVKVDCFKRKDNDQYYAPFDCTPPYVNVTKGQLSAISCVRHGCDPGEGNTYRYSYIVFIDGQKALDPEIRVKGGNGGLDTCRKLDPSVPEQRATIDECELMK